MLMVKEYINNVKIKHIMPKKLNNTYLVQMDFLLIVEMRKKPI